MSTVCALALPDGAVDLWVASPDRWAPCTAAVAAAEALLAPDEREHSRRRRDATDRLGAVLARALLRVTLSRYADVAPPDWRFTVGPHGRPRLARPMQARSPLSFNVSHTHGLLAIAVSGAPVGVDVEAVDRLVSLGVARRFFAPAEQDMLDALDAARRPRRFLELWTLKESYAKARGLGLRLRFDTFAFGLDDSGDVRFRAARGARAGGRPWCFHVLELGTGHVCALCTRRTASAPAITCRSIEPDMTLVDLPSRLLHASRQHVEPAPRVKR